MMMEEAARPMEMHAIRGVLRRSVALCGDRWRSVAIGGVLRRSVAFCGDRWRSGALGGAMPEYSANRDHTNRYTGPERSARTDSTRWDNDMETSGFYTTRNVAIREKMPHVIRRLSSTTANDLK